MTSEVRVKETDEHQTVVGQERPTIEEQPATREGMREPGDEATPSGIPLAAPPVPPKGRVAASIQRMPLAWRWVLGLALAFLSGFVIVTLGGISSTATAFACAIMVGLALAAGFVLSSWWSFLALAIASAIGAGVGSWVAVQMSPPGSIEGLTGISAVSLLLFFYALLDQGPLILFLLAGTGIGKLQGITLGTPHPLSAREASVSRWISALALAIAGGFLTQPLGNMPVLLAMQATPGDILGILPGILYAIVIAATCLLAGWLLRSWWGCVVVSIAYVCGFALTRLPFGGVGTVVGFVLYIVLPAVVMSVIGTVIGMQRTRRRAAQA